MATLGKESPSLHMRNSTACTTYVASNCYFTLILRSCTSCV